MKSPDRENSISILTEGKNPEAPVWQKFFRVLPAPLLCAVLNSACVSITVANQTEAQAQLRYLDRLSNIVFNRGLIATGALVGIYLVGRLFITKGFDSINDMAQLKQIMREQEKERRRQRRR